MVKLSKYKYRALSQVYINFSAVFLASVVLPVIFSFDNFSWFIFVFGIICVVGFLILSLLFAEKGKL